MKSTPYSNKTPWAIPLVLLSILTFVGCSAVGPDYSPPNPPIPETWNQDPARVPSGEGVIQWWRLFEDPLLDELIETASRNNHDLKTAMARVDEVGARLGIEQSRELPQLDLDSQVNRQFNSENTMDKGSVETRHELGLNAGWEVDLFGRVRRSVEAARADFQVSLEDRTDVMIRLYAQVSLSYLRIRTYQARLGYARENIRSQEQLMELTRARYDHGLATGLDLAQAQRFLARAQAELPPLHIALTREMNQLALLLGEAPGRVNRLVSQARPIPNAPTAVVGRVPADLLRQRPDIRRAERELAAATARVGIAAAELYPRLTLNGSFGYAATDIGDWFTAGSRQIHFGPSLRWNLFSRDKIYQEIKAREAVTRRFFFQYEHTVLAALGEVETHMERHHQDRVRLARLEKAVAAARRSVTLSTRLYKKGLVDFQPVLDAQRDQFNFEDQLAIARGNVAANFVTLYRVMGGGWNPSARNL